MNISIWIDIESGQPCIVSDFSGIDLHFFTFNLMLAIRLLQIALIMFMYIYCNPNVCSVFVMKSIGYSQRSFLQLI